MPETIQAYLEAVEEQIRWKRARYVVSLELRRHLEDQRDAFAAEGLENPERLAVEEMGDPVSVGTELDRLHRPRPQWGLLGLTVALACAGAFLRGWLTGGNGAALMKTFLALVLGIAVLLGMYFLDFSALGRHAGRVYTGALAAGVLALLLSPEVNCVPYYARYVVLAYPVAYAAWLYRCRGSGWRHFGMAVAGGIPLAAVCLLIPYTLELFILLVCGLVLLLCAIRQGWFGSCRRRYAATALALAAGMAPLSLGTCGETFLNRLRFVLYPELDPYGRGYMGWITRMLMESVPLFRRSGGASMGAGQVIGFYDAPFSGQVGPLELDWGQDFIPLKLLVSRGWLVCVILMAAIAALLAWLLIRCLRQRQHLGRLVTLAVVLSLGLEALFSVALNFGVPLFSAHLLLITGNLHTVLDMALIGLALSVFRGRDVLRDEAPSEKGRPILPWRIKISIVPTKTD